MVPWPVLCIAGWAFLDATLRGTEGRRHWWGPLLRPLDEKDEEEEVEEGATEVRWGEGMVGGRTRVQI